MNEMAFYFADTVLLVIDHKVPDHTAEHTRRMRRWMEIWRGFEVQ